MAIPAQSMIDILEGTFHRAKHDEATVERLLADLRDLNVVDSPPFSLEYSSEEDYFTGDLDSEIPDKYSLGDITVELNHPGRYFEKADDIEAKVSFDYGRMPVLAVDNIVVRNVFGGSRQYAGVLEREVMPEADGINRVLGHYNLID